MPRKKKSKPEKQIFFFSEKISFSLSSEKKIGKWLCETFIDEGFIADHLNYIFCSDKFLLELNTKFLNHQTLTDILTFDYTDEETPEYISGEIYISVPRVKENAKKFLVSFDEELKRVMVHGALHLCGYRDKTSAEKKRMRQKENDYLKKIS